MADVVSMTYERFKAFASGNGLGKPDKILSAELEDHGAFGIGAQWGEGNNAIRQAFRVSDRETMERLRGMFSSCVPV